ncbi:hypothetical protein [Streptomyces sp. MJM1172]|uniref:hypothetical protein n=1 Tax=Streptomyces sp. MJM1172 TaxID=1703926 RepID=UPI0009401803|nr:hypothetical protein [Streptomyces sp. MJM1172]OKI50337.1 hypothetical protein AMK15_32805 [Streptomyces sp. MJM1172]
MTEAVASATEETPAADRPAVVNGAELAGELGVAARTVTRGLELGLIPPRDKSRGWSRAAADGIASRIEEIREGIADHEALGSRRIADLLTELTELAVEQDDVQQLAERGYLRVLDEYKGWPLYAVKDARRAGETPEIRAVLNELITARLEERARREAERQEWHAVSIASVEAAARLGWKVDELVTVARNGRIAAGKDGRYATADLDVLAADEELCEQVLGDRLIRADEAAGLLEIRHPTDWKHVVAAGWITPKTTTEARVGRNRWIEVPLFETRAVEALRDLPGVPWEEVRAAKPGDPSPLLEFARRTPSRADAIHQFAGSLADRHQVTVWAEFDDRRGEWSLDWTHDDQGAPTPEQVTAELRTDTQAARYAREIQVGGTRWGRRARWAQTLLDPDVAVVLCTRGRATLPFNTEVDDELAEIAVVDVVTGKVLLDTPVRTPAPPGKEQPDGPEEQDLPGARDWEKVLPRLRAVTRGRLIVPCNPAHDRQRITTATDRVGKRLLHLGAQEAWALAQGERPLDHVAGWPARHGCEYVREALLSAARGRGRTHRPQSDEEANF